MDGFSKRFHGIVTMVTALVSLLILSACDHDFYKTGDSDLSYLHTDFVEALQPALKTPWATKGDTVYRALLHYNKVEKGVTEPVGISPVAVLHIRLSIDLPQVPADPVTFESAWVSRNRKYLNLGLKLKTGQSSGVRAVQSLGIVCNSVRRQPDGGRTFYLQLYHQQNGVPEYYSTRVFASIPLADLKEKDSIVLDINSYKGKVRKRIAF